MSLTDPLSDYRLGPATSAQDLREEIVSSEGELMGFWPKGAPVALTPRALYFVQDETAYRIARKDVRSFGLTRSSNKRFMRWGLLLYLLALPVMFFAPLPAIGLALVGGGLVTKGFLNKAILVQADDERVPPFILDNPKWRNLRDALREWQ